MLELMLLVGLLLLLLEAITNRQLLRGVCVCGMWACVATARHVASTLSLLGNFVQGLLRRSHLLETVT